MQSGVRVLAGAWRRWARLAEIAGRLSGAMRPVYRRTLWVNATGTFGHQFGRQIQPEGSTYRFEQ